MITENTLPQNTEIEDAVLGAILIDSGCLNLAMSRLFEDMFYRIDSKAIFKAIQTLYDHGQGVDLIMVVEELKRQNNIELAGGAYRLVKLTNSVVSSAHIEYHINVLSEMYLKRQMIEISHDAFSRAFLDETDVFDLISQTDDKIQKSQEKVITGMSKDIAYFGMKVIEQHATVKHTGVLGIKTGISELDKAACGLVSPDLIIVAARPGAGKTAMALSITYNISVLQRIPCAWFSLEMDGVQLVRRLVSMDSGIPHEAIRNGHTSLEQDKAIGESVDKIGNSPIYIEDRTSMNIRDIRTRASLLKKKHNIGLVIVDYIQLMSGIDSKGKNREQVVSEISRGLKCLAKELEMPVIALSQLSRAVESRADKMPMLSDLRESGCLTADTKIYVPSHKKICRIIDLVGEKGFSIFANHQNSNIEMKAKSGFYSGKKEVFEMKLLNGMSIKATSNHKFLTPDGWKPLSELSDCKIALPMNYESDNIHEISEQEARLVGHFISNGSCLKNLPIRYCCNVKDTDLSDLVISDAVFASNGEVSPARKDTLLERGSFSTVFFKPNFNPSRNRRSPISEIMRKYKLYDVRSKYKKIPDEFYFLTKKNTNEFLSALFSGDGTVYYAETKGRKTLKISYSSSSVDLIEGIQFLLMKVGIVSFYSKLKKGEFTWYNLYISGKANIEMFVKNIGFKNKRKNDIMLNGWEKSKSNLAGWNKYDYNENRTICFMPVSGIESIGEQDVYDIEVPQSHNFNANGIITHNSLEQDADSVMFLMRPEYYGMTEPVQIGNTEFPVQRLAICSIAKNRHGQTKNIALEFTGNTMTFTDHELNNSGF